METFVMMKAPRFSTLCLGMMKLRRKSFSVVKGVLSLFWMRCCGVKVGDDTIVRGWCYFWRNPKAQLRLGEQVRLNSGIVENPVSGGHRLALIAGHEGACLEIGAGSAISASIIYARQSIKIGKRVMIGAGCAIYDNDFHSVHFEDRHHGNINIETAPIVIEDDVWLGAEVMVLKGVCIGKGSVIGARSVVTREIPPNVLAVGSPAKVVRNL